MTDETMDRAAHRLSDTGPHLWSCATCTAAGTVDGVVGGDATVIAETVAGLPVVGIPVETREGIPVVRPATTDAEMVNARGAIVWEFPCPVCGTVLQAGGDQ